MLTWALISTFAIDCYARFGGVGLARLEFTWKVLEGIIHEIWVLETNNPEAAALLNFLDVGAILLSDKTSDLVFILAVANKQRLAGWREFLFGSIFF
jgi:hypothetical protein